ncbi:hypothetical protein JOM56_001050 [Amanita muscaria]
MERDIISLGNKIYTTKLTVATDLVSSKPRERARRTASSSSKSRCLSDFWADEVSLWLSEPVGPPDAGVRSRIISGEEIFCLVKVTLLERLLGGRVGRMTRRRGSAPSAGVRSRVISGEEIFYLVKVTLLERLLGRRGGTILGRTSGTRGQLVVVGAGGTTGLLLRSGETRGRTVMVVVALVLMICRCFATSTTASRGHFGLERFGTRRAGG